MCVCVCVSLRYNPRGKSADSKNKWLIPVCFVAQLLLKKLVFDKAVKKWDNYHGDEWGPKQQEFKDDKCVLLPLPLLSLFSLSPLSPLSLCSLDFR